MSSVDFATWVYEPCFGIFARSVTCYPVKSQPGVPGFITRGIFDTNEIDVEAALATFTSIVEPALICFLGAAIGTIVASVIVPLYSMIGNIR